MKQRNFHFIAVALMAAVFTAQSPAQDLGSLGKQAQNMGGLGNMSAIAQKLHLSPGQMQQVMPILQSEMSKLQAIKGNSNLSSGQKVTQTKAVQQHSDSKLKTILSPSQLGSLQGLRAEQLQGLTQGAMPH
jgi:hypothetical protein